jgi:hypothetical protein
MLGYQPAPFTTEPGWLAPLSPLHQNPEYRDPKFSKPNYVYVRVRNRGSSASAGTERLRVYWAKASTGLGWPAQWVDYRATHCGPNKLYGIEITKPRRNAAASTAAERTAYVNAVLGADTLKWTADLVSYFDKQDQVHEKAAQHSVEAFLPWHREMMNRYEILLRETDPTLTLLYWDWTTDPTNSTGGVNLMTSSFLGTANGVVGAPFASLHANGVCTNARAGEVFPSTTSLCLLHADDWTYPPPSIYRSKMAGSPVTALGADSDAFRLSQTTFPSFRDMEGNPHGIAHIYMADDKGGTELANLGIIEHAAEAPFFFLLHANCDRLWAMWQRDAGFVSRRNPPTAYGTESTSASITNTMPPWNGKSGIKPWTSSPGDYTYAKTAKDPSVVDAPIYDTAPLTIPVLQSNESCVIEIPWYPPNPADYSCFGADQGHVCLLARIETDTSPPYGMSVAEGSDVDANTRNNNNIVWKNITVQDKSPGSLMSATTLLRNLSANATVATRIRLRLPPEEQANGLFGFGTLLLNLGPTLYPRWLQNGASGQGIVTGAGSNTVQVISPDAFLDNIPLQAGEALAVELDLRLSANYPHPQGRVYHVDLEQYSLLNNLAQFVGGQRVEFNFNKLVLVPAGATWRYWDTGQFPDAVWSTLNYDDSLWPAGQAQFGYGDDDGTTPFTPTVSCSAAHKCLLV